MQYQKLELHLAQVERAITHFRSKFPHKKKTEIYEGLIQLFQAVKTSSYKTLSPDDLNGAKLALDVVFYGIEHLDYKNEREIPKRLIYCLNEVLNDWITNGTESYYIVVSYNKTPDNFVMRAWDEGVVKQLDLYFKTLFGVGYTQSLIQISKPRFLIDDYIGSIPVYHELGHFIEKNYQVVKSLFRDRAFLLTLAPAFAANLLTAQMHYEEHFADIFAAQYIGKSSIEPLNYIAYNARKQGNGTHPSNERRIEVVNAFLLGSGAADVMQIVNDLKKYTLIRTGRELEIRNIALNTAENPFEILRPLKLDQTQKLHSLYLQGWSSWLDPNSTIRKKYTAHLECCSIINSLIRDSIRLTMEDREKNWKKRVGNKIRNVFGLAK